MGSEVALAEFQNRMAMQNSLILQKSHPVSKLFGSLCHCTNKILGERVVDSPLKSPGVISRLRTPKFDTGMLIIACINMLSVESC